MKEQETENLAASALGTLVEQVPAIKLERIETSPGADRGVDILAHIIVAGRPHVLACEVKASGQPRHVRAALFQLRSAVAHSATPVFIAPYLSPEAQSLCREQNVGFLDLEGNARLVVDEVFIGKRSVRSESALNTMNTRLSA